MIKMSLRFLLRFVPEFPIKRERGRKTSTSFQSAQPRSTFVILEGFPLRSYDGPGLPTLHSLRRICEPKMKFFRIAPTLRIRRCWQIRHESLHESWKSGLELGVSVQLDSRPWFDCTRLLCRGQCFLIYFLDSRTSQRVCGLRASLV